jgi:type IV fimbrial biogenesis protein FimT
MSSTYIHSLPSDFAKRARWQAGFTLIELLMTMAIGTTLMLVTVPSFLDFQKNSRLSDTVSNFLSAANTARSNSMKQGFNSYLVPLDSGTNWSVGWMVYTDKNWNQTYDAATDEVVLRHDALDPDINITTTSGTSLASGYLLFNGSGYPRMKNGSAVANQTMVIKSIKTSRASSIIVDVPGRVRSCRSYPTNSC